MNNIPFLKWLAGETKTQWWHDSADTNEINISLGNGAVGVTTNPPLAAAALNADPEGWRPAIEDISKDLSPNEMTEERIRRVTLKAAELMMPTFESTNKMHGYVCAQVNPQIPGEAKEMFEMAKRLHDWAPNIAVKLPVTNAGLEILEECAALGITVVGTVSFTLPQVLAVAERYQAGLARARKAGVEPGRCFAVVMVGRIDDYIRDVAHDTKADVSESDIIQCGNAIIKRGAQIFKEKGYEAVLMPAGMRGAYHATEIAGADLTMSIHPKIQKMLAELSGPFEERIDVPVDKDVLDRLSKIPEFVKAYEPDVMKPDEFMSYGVVQKTLAQFLATGWQAVQKF